MECRGKIILFGSGKIGQKVLEKLGEDYVYCFCDNNTSLAGAERYHKRIISFQELKEIYSGYIVIISADENNTEDIARQLENEGIYDYLSYSDIEKNLIKNNEISEFIRKYLNPVERMKFKADLLEKKLNRASFQLEYLKDHTAVETLKPAEGYLRKRQLDLIEFADEFLEKVSGLQISPFLTGGSLLGYVRNQEFIPWEDSLELGLTREDYERLCEYCRKSYYGVCRNGGEECCGENEMQQTDTVTRRHKNEIVFFEYPDTIQISKGKSCIDRLWIDFNMYDFDEFSGLDGDCLKNLREAVFPLREDFFAGRKFFVPQEARQVVRFFQPGYLNIPDDIGIGKNEFWNVYKESRLVNIEFYLSASFEISHFEPLYYFFRNKGVYAVFVAENCRRNTTKEWFDYEAAVAQLKERKLEYKTVCNPDAQFAFSTQGSWVLKKYGMNTKRIHIHYGCSLLNDSFWYFSKHMQGYDYKFVHGIYDKEMCLKIMPEEKIKIVGYPRHYGIRNKKLSTESVRRELGIGKGKPVICYLPTWDQHASIERFRGAFLKLRKDYYIVTKPHHCLYMRKEKKRELDILYEISDMVLDTFYSLEKASFIGDITIIDAKSAATLEACFINPEMKMLWLSVRKDMKAIFSEKAFDLAKIINDPDEFGESIRELLDNDRYREVRKKQIYYFFEDGDERCLEKAYEDVLRDCPAAMIRQQN